MLGSTLSVQNRMTVWQPYPESEQHRSVAWTPPNVLRVEFGVRLAHEGGLQHVPTLTVLQEAAPIQVHLLTWGLKIQSNWRTHQCVSGTPSD